MHVLESVGRGDGGRVESFELGATVGVEKEEEASATTFGVMFQGQTSW